jgi:hypothetical protein
VVYKPKAKSQKPNLGPIKQPLSIVEHLDLLFITLIFFCIQKYMYLFLEIFVMLLEHMFMLVVQIFNF